MKNVLITGITGFAGPHLANHLAESDPNHEIRLFGLVRASNGRETDIRDIVPDDVFNRITFVYGDFSNYESVKQIFTEYCFNEIYHLGAQSHPGKSFIYPRCTFLNNALGTINLVNAIEKLNPECKFMNCSTSEVYGDVPEHIQPITEDFRIAPVNPYGVSKAAADLYVTERAHSADLQLFNTRAFSHTGPRRGFRFSISGDAYQLIRIKKGFQKPVVSVGTLSSKRVVMDVRDCVRAYKLLMADFTPGESYNVGGGAFDTIGGFLEQMIDVVGLKDQVTTEVNPAFVRKIDIATQIPDSSKCFDLIGWRPKIPIKQTLTDLLGYWDAKITK